MNKLKESELLRSFAGFFLLFLLFVGILIFIVPSSHQSSKISDKIRSVKKEKVTYVAIGDSLTQGVGDSSNQGGDVYKRQVLQSFFSVFRFFQSQVNKGELSCQTIYRSHP